VHAGAIHTYIRSFIHSVLFSPEVKITQNRTTRNEKRRQLCMPNHACLTLLVVCTEECCQEWTDGKKKKKKWRKEKE
jgi:hypothetical protein